ncbi:MAG: DNA translocase FtsK [Candidatus Omnitrophota bacterium]
MPRKKRSAPRQSAPRFSIDEAKKNELMAVLFLAIAAFIFISLISFDVSDIPFYSTSAGIGVKNFTGIIGAYIGWALLFSIGYAAYIIPAVVLFWALGRFLKLRPQKMHIKLFGTLVSILATSSLLSMIFIETSTNRFQKGGITGLVLSDFFVKYFGSAGAYVFSASLLLLSLILATEFLIFPVFLNAARGSFRWVAAAGTNLRLSLSSAKIRAAEKKRARPQIKTQAPSRPALRRADEAKPGPEAGAPGVKPPTIKVQLPKVPKPKPATKPAAKKTPQGDYKLPSLDLLTSPPPIEERKIKDDLEANSRILEETLADFGVEAKVVQVNQGPVITRYELEPAPGERVSKITALSDDIALTMKAQSVRIVAPIPGKGTVGIEVPNSSSTLVYLKEILESPEFQESDSKLTMALGKDISGTPVIADLGDMPHLLIAGATGSGKTVCVNSIITSMLFNATPDEVKFLMVDPKMVELAIFNKIPHLLCPVVTNAKKVSAALDWVVSEMESRYKMFAKVAARNIDIYNEKVEDGKVKSEDPEETVAKLPYIVVIIDELADLMVVAQQEIESAIMRLAQLSRAVGIHIILATQRPSVDVITGVIKANFPARISFKVVSKVDSRTVLDVNGADKLLGRGDMLFIEPGATKPVRAQASLVSDSEIERVADFVKTQRDAQYNDEILEEQEKKIRMKQFDKDEIYDEAVRVILESNQASVSILQRRLGLGYTRAARIIDMMEQEGVVGPYQGSKPRDILVSRQESVKKEG